MEMTVIRKPVEPVIPPVDKVILSLNEMEAKIVQQALRISKPSNYTLIRHFDIACAIQEQLSYAGFKYNNA